VTTYITKGAPFSLGSPFIRIQQLSVLAMKKSYDEWPPGKFFRQHVSEDKTCQNDLW